jgi:hypothetical protein
MDEFEKQDAELNAALIQAKKDGEIVMVYDKIFVDGSPLLVPSMAIYPDD